MTITNRVQKIQDLCCEVIEAVDRRNYQKAQLDLDRIDVQLRASRRHIDNLQTIHSPFLVSEENKP
ncbi:MAG: hypothetical protein NWE89_05975 [Candidatus Bathyarchaeota archaeon]|nr:hypothetical protein [Candidatus Bathyarchaeota archaeon]